MIKIARLEDTGLIRDDPEMWREVFGYLSVCTAELKEYTDEEDLDEYDFNFLVATEADFDYVQNLGVPEEIVDIDISSGQERRKIRRMVYVTEVVFIDAEGDEPATREK